MRTGSSTLLVTVTAVLLGLLAWRIWGTAGERRPPGEPPSPNGVTDHQPQDPALPSPSLQGREHEPTDATRFPAPDAPDQALGLVVRVLDDARGRAIQDAVVHLVQGEDAPRVFRTNDAGVVTFGALRAGATRIVARAPTFVRAEAHRMLDASGPTLLELRLARGIVLEGTVVERGSGHAVAGASIVVVPGGSLDGWTEMSAASPFGSAVTDEQGRFVVGTAAPDALLTVRATAEGYGVASQSMRLAAIRDTPTAVVLRLARTAALTGTVMQAGGEPAAGARVYAVPADAPDMLIADPETHCTSNGRPFQSLRGLADHDGTFRIDGLELGALYTVFAELAGHGRSALEKGVVATEDDLDPHVELLLPGAASLTVRLHTPEGGLQEEGRLMLFGDGFPLQLELQSPGVFVAHEPPPGTYTLRVVCAGLVMQERPVEIRATKHETLEIHLKRGLVLAGVLVDDTGRPITGQKLWVDRPWQESGKHPPSKGDAVTDDEGRFAIAGLQGGPHALHLILGRHVVPEDLRLLPPDENVRVVALRKAGLRVRVVLPSGFDPPDEVGIRVGREEDGGYGESGHALPWDANELRFDDLAPGPLRVRIQVEGLLEVVRDLTLQPGDVADLGTIALRAGFELAGRVVDGEDRPVAGARVAAGQVWTPMYRTVATDATGRFVLPAFARGTSEIEITATGFLPRTLEVDLPQDAGGRSFALDRGCLVTVHVTAADGKPAPARRVRWRPAQAPEATEDADSEETDAKGRLEVRLRDGAWIFEVLDDDWHPLTSAEVDLTEGGTTTVPLALPR